MDNNSNFSLFLLNGNQKCTFTNKILIRYVGTFIFFIGILSTLLSICVFTRKPLRRKSCCFYFLILAISDSIHLTTMTIENFPYSFHLDIIIIHSFICKIIIFLIYFSNHLSNVILTLASIDRFVLIYYPSRSKRYCNINLARWLVVIVIIIIFLSNGHILYGFEKISFDLYESYQCIIPPDNILYAKFFHFYDSYIESICFVLIPFLLMGLSSLLIIYQIIVSRRTIRSNSRIQKSRLRDKDIQLSCMLISTSFAFLLLCLPAEINDIFNHIAYESSCFHWCRKVILMLMQQIYYAGHFYIYTLTGQIFRKHLYEILCAYRHRPAYMNKTTIERGITEQNLCINMDDNRITTNFVEDQSQKSFSDSKHLTYV